MSAIDQEILTPLVRKALGNERVEVINWHYRPLAGGYGHLGAGPQGVCRFEGTARDLSETRSWALILKFSKTQAHGGDPEGGTREWQAYQSGVLDNLPGGIVAARCFGLSEIAEEQLRLIWLEDIADAYANWPLERYALAARHLGQLNGAYLAPDSLPDWVWMSRGWLRQKRVTQAATAISQLESVRDHPMVRRPYPPDVVNGLLRIWEGREFFLDGLDRLPQTFCHRDAFRRNLFARRDANGQDQTVLIDWAFSGVGAVGEELVALIQGTTRFREVKRADLQALETLAFDGYLEGLRDAGWLGSPQIVRCAYTAATALRYGVGTIGLVLPTLMDERWHELLEQEFGLPIEVLADEMGELNRSTTRMADEARSLMTELL